MTYICLLKLKGVTKIEVFWKGQTYKSKLDASGFRSGGGGGGKAERYVASVLLKHFHLCCTRSIHKVSRIVEVCR